MKNLYIVKNLFSKMRDIWNLNYRWELIDNTWTNVPILDDIDETTSVFNINDNYFKYQKCLSGITYQFVNQLDNIYEKNLMVGKNYCIYYMYNEFDIINNFMINLYQVDVCCTGNTLTGLTQRYFQLDGAYLKTGHRVLLTGQNDTHENDIYTVDSRGHLILSDELSDTGRTWRYKAYVKLGNNKGKQFHLKNIGNRFPLTSEKKEFLEGHGYIIKSFFNYNLFDVSVVPGLIFTDYEVARISVNHNYDLYNGFVFDNMMAGGNINIRYHDENYRLTIREVSDNSYIYYNTGITSAVTFNINNETFVLISGTTSSPNDYVKINVTSELNFNLKTFIKRIEYYSGERYVVIKDYIPDSILNTYYQTTGTTVLSFTNLMYCHPEDDLAEVLSESYYAKYFTIEYKYISINDTQKRFVINPKEYEYNKYFDYDALIFETNTNVGNLTGVVRGLNSIPLIGVNISGGTSSVTTTDNDGYYSISLQLDTPQTVYFNYPHYIPFVTGVTISTGSSLILDINMTHYTGTISGYTLDNINSNPIQGARVDTGITSYNLTDSNGEFILNDVLSGNKTIYVDKTGYVSQTSSVDVPDSGTTSITFRLVPTNNVGNLSGITYLSGTTTPLTGATVTITSVIPTNSTTGDINGAYYFNNIKAQVLHQVSCSLNDYATQIKSVTIPYSGLTSLDFELSQYTGSLSGITTAIYPPYPFVSGITVKINGTSLGSTDTNGEYMITGLTSGSYIVSTYSPYWETKSIFPVVIISNNTTEQNFDNLIPIPYNGYVSGITRSVLGPIVPSVYVYTGSTYTNGTQSDSSGEYLLGGLRVSNSPFYLQTEVTNYFDTGATVPVSYNEITEQNFDLIPSIFWISGYTLDIDTLSPIQNVSLQCDSSYGTSGIDGSYLINNISRPDPIVIGSKNVIATNSDYYSVILTAGTYMTGVRLDFNMKHLTGTTFGYVKNLYAPSIFKVTGATVTIGSLSTITDTNGYYSISGSNTGNITAVSVEPNEYYQGSASGILTTSGLNLDILQPHYTGRCYGTITNICGTLLPNINLTLVYPIGMTHNNDNYTISDVNGNYSFTGQTIDDYLLIPPTPSYNNYSKIITLTKDSNLLVNIQLTGITSLGVTVLDDSIPLENIPIYINTILKGYTNSSGYLLVSDCPLNPSVEVTVIVSLIEHTFFVNTCTDNTITINV